MNDRRIALELGTELFIDNRKIQIRSESGRGANCIVYDSVYIDQAGVTHKARIKECYPVYLQLDRNCSGEILASESDYIKFNNAKEEFKQVYKKNAEIRNTSGLINSTINASDLFYINGTYYTIMPFYEGSDYRSYTDTSLKELFEHIHSFAELIKKYHENGYLYLDIKPENILVIPETTEHIYLFDFDSLVTLEELKKNAQCRLSFSDGFSAPEQIQGKTSKIGHHTDIYSIGALVFYKIFGRKPRLDDCKISAKFDFSQMKYKDNRYQPVLFKKITTFLKKSLSVSIISRWGNIQSLIDAVNELIQLSDVESTFVYDSFQYNSNCFIGRAKELENIHKKLKEQQLIFLSGIGGIGKTEIARKYAQKYREFYNTIIFSVFDSSIKKLVNNEVIVNGILQDIDEDDETYFERKLNILKKILSPNDLIIIDNFDVDFDEKLEKIFKCPCKFIITTREDFRDYNYTQININKIENPDEVLKLFNTYNDIDYTISEFEAVKNIISIIDSHTMTVGLIAKYLRETGTSPEDLYKKFLQKEGIMNTKETGVKHRKDSRLCKESVNNHIRILFNLSDFSLSEKEIISSLSLFGNIRISKAKFEELCSLDNVSSKIDTLIKKGWIEYNALQEKISLHQIIQDLVYNDLKPDAQNCPHIAEGMKLFINAETPNYSEKKIKRKFFEIFMERLTGTSLLYADLCMVYGTENKLEEAEKICLISQEKEALYILQKIYSKKINLYTKYNDMVESELDLDEYFKSKFSKIAVIFGKLKNICEQYCGSPEETARIYVKILTEIETNITQNMWLVSDEVRIVELDEIYFQIFDMLETATQNIFIADIPVNEKEELLIQIQRFYLGEGLLEKYRFKYFANTEKAYWYQQQINNLKSNTHVYGNNITSSTIALEYEEKGEYNKAIKFYKKAYENGENVYKDAWYNIANVYKNTGRIEQTVVYLKRILAMDKKKLKEIQDYYLYSSDVCYELIGLLILQKRYNMAKQYAYELVYYNKPMVSDEDNVHYIKYVIFANYQLYEIEQNIQQKKYCWNECIKYYSILEANDDINNNIFDFVIDFIIAYIKNMDISDKMFDKIIFISKHLNISETGNKQKELLKYAINVCCSNRGYEKWHIIFLIKYAVLLSDLHYGKYNEAFDYCKLAQDFYNKYGLQDSYCQNLIYKAMAECMTKHFDQIDELKKKCNYALLAEEDAKLCHSSRKDAIEIWKDAAESYSYIGYYKQEVFCLQKALSIITPVFNQYEYSFYNNYWQIIKCLIMASISSGNHKETYNIIEEIYASNLNYYSKSEEESNKSWSLTITCLAEYIEELQLFREAIDMYFYAIYVVICDKPHISLIDKITLQETKRYQLCENIKKIIKNDIDNDTIDTIVNLKDKILVLLDKTKIDYNYSSLLQYISEKYQYHDIEFKK